MQVISTMILVPLAAFLFASVEAGQASPVVAQLAAEGAQASDAHLNTVAGALTDLLKSSDKSAASSLSSIAQVSNTSAIVDTIKDLLNATMKGRLFTAHKNSLAAIADSKKLFTDCRETYQAADHVRFPPASLLQTVNATPWYEEFFQAYSQCKQWEAQIGKDMTACDYHCTSEVKVVGEDCTFLGDQCGPLDCAPVTGEGYKSFLERMIKDDIKTHLDFLVWERYNETHGCNDIWGTAERCFKNCDGHVMEIQDLVPHKSTDIPGCCAPRTQAEDAKCQELKSQRVTWQTYDQCYDAALPQWETTKEEQMAEADSRKAQMRSILRMLCYVSSFGPNQAALLTQCMEKDFKEDPDVLAMNIDLGTPETKLDAFSCNSSETPGTAEFDAAHYGDLPAGLATCPQLHCEEACNGEVNISSMQILSATTASPLPEMTTASTKCFKKAGGADAVYWDLGSKQAVGAVFADPSDDVSSIKVYLTNSEHGTVLPTAELCGTITEESKTVDCGARSGARYLVMQPFITGTCVFGGCTPSWCLMTVDGSNMTQEPMSTTGSSFMGQVVVNATA
eukprot:s7452_g2.t1